MLLRSIIADWAIPVRFRCGDGNASDATTHNNIWHNLRSKAGDAGFLHVADSKLCAHDAIGFIDAHEARAAKVLQRPARLTSVGAQLRFNRGLFRMVRVKVHLF